MTNNITYRRTIAILLLVSMISLCGCGSKGKETSAPITNASSDGTPSQNYSVLIEDTVTPTGTPAPTPIETPIPTPVPTQGLTQMQRNSINMLNYMLVLTQQINEERKNQLFLESAYDSFDNLHPNAVDNMTQAQIKSLMDTIQGYRMIDVKRARLEYINEQNRAHALRNAMPNPIGLLSAVQSGNILKSAVSALYMVVDSENSINAAISQADRQYVEEGWELDDAEALKLHENTKNSLSYLLQMVQTYNLPGDYALSRKAIEDFVKCSRKPDSQLSQKISWLKSHEDVYREFGPYWLEIAKNYYTAKNYEECLAAISKYESVQTRIFRLDIDYATALPMAIVSAKETLAPSEYVKVAEQYCKVIYDTTKDSDWSLMFFAARTYVDLYEITSDIRYLNEAYKIVHDNIVNNLIDSQKTLNEAYLKSVEELKIPIPKDATDRSKKEIKAYNKLITEERTTALPPVNEALYLNCELLFALAEEIGISEDKQKEVDDILHEDGANLFLPSALDARFWFTKEIDQIDTSEIDISFSGEKMTIPAVCISDRSAITVTITGPSGTSVLDDWTVKEVKRPKNAVCDEFVVTFVSKKDYKYQDGETIIIRVIPVAYSSDEAEQSSDEFIEFTFKATADKKAVVFNGISFERVA